MVKRNERISLKNSFFLMIISIVSILIGFLRDLVLSNQYGASDSSDIFLMLLNIPIIVFATIGAAINTTYIPLYSEINYNKTEEHSLKFTNKVMNIILIFCLILIIIFLINAEKIVKIFAMGFSGEKLRISIRLTRIIILSLFFIGPNYLLTSFLNLKNIFIIPAIVPIITNLLIIIFIIFSKGNLTFLVIGTVFAYAVQILILYYYSRKNNYKISLDLKLNDSNIKKMFCLVIPVLFGTAVAQFNEVIDRSLASTLGEGMLSCFTYSNRISSSIQILFVSSLITLIYPKMNKLYSSKKVGEFKQLVIESLKNIIILILPLASVVYIFSEQIVLILFERGTFSRESTLITSGILKVYIVGIIFWTLREVLVRALYSLNNTKLATFNSVTAIFVNLILNLIFIDIYGYKGLAYASTITAFIVCILLARSLQKKIGPFIKIKDIFDIAKGIVILSLIVIIIKVFYYYINNLKLPIIINLFISCGVGLSLYLFIVYKLKLLKIKDIFNKSE